ncbi:amidase domain-containing protein [Nonomuraea sp. NPDC049725]|uniref:amidase domain-containing protein n=1 Tax=Nonomuraea sp. NPDC049725 TaxID=3154508 RepID=UPI00344AD546
MRITLLRSVKAFVAASATALTMAAAPAGASSAEEPQFAEIARQYLQDRATRLVSDAPARTLTSVPSTGALADRLTREAAAIDERRRLLREANGGHKQADVQVAEVASTREGDTVELRVAERTKLYFARPLADAPAFEEYALNHRFVFERQGAQWVMRDARPEPAAGELAPDTQPQAARAPKTSPKATAPAGREPSSVDRPRKGAAVAPDKLARSTEAALAWDYTAMLNYANTYWDTYNPDYRTYGGVGGDCTNFISQIVTAGGWTEVGSWPDSRSDNANWFYGDYTWTTSYTWPAAENWYWFAQHESARTTYLGNVWDMLTTDVLQVDFDRDDNISHSLFVTDRSSDGELYLTYHSNNTHNKPLSSFLAANPDAWYYAHRT